MVSASTAERTKAPEGASAPQSPQITSPACGRILASAERIARVRGSSSRSRLRTKRPTSQRAASSALVNEMLVLRRVRNVGSTGINKPGKAASPLETSLAAESVHRTRGTSDGVDPLIFGERD